jgi:glucosamine--fructose-6-phosphate aminotransferase (isomerizing)
VATTKAYTSQLINLTLFALALGSNTPQFLSRREEIVHGLRVLPRQMRTVLLLDHTIKKLCAKMLCSAKGMLVLGRGYQFATACEAALKIKEVSYIHCEAVRSGELKHGVLALVDCELPVVMIATRDKSFQRTLNSHEQRKIPRYCRKRYNTYERCLPLTSLSQLQFFPMVASLS